MKNKRRVWIGFSISLLVHGVIIGSFCFFPLQSNSKLEQMHAKSIALSLAMFQKAKTVSPTVDVKEAVPEQKIEVTQKPSHPNKEKKIVSKELPKMGPTTSREEFFEEKNDTSKAQSSPQPLVSEKVNDTFLADIQAIIEKNKTYPKWARKHKIEGTVILEFEINHNGAMLWSKVITSSGSTALDEHALSVLEKASLSFPKPSHIQVIKLPMVYRLIL